MKFRLLIIILCAYAVCNATSAIGENCRTDKIFPTLDEIMAKVEDKYAESGFSAHFDQISTIKAMEITDTASGKVFIKPPGMMRWEYEKPDKQIIISNNKKLWVYRPEDNQVMIGKSPFFFGNGKGAGFLSDIKLIKQKFNIILEKEMADNSYILKLLPKDKTFDISVIYLSISKNSFNIIQIITYNSYEDKTLIDLKNIRFKQVIEDSMFSFKIPEGTDILRLDE
ncbi:MAG: outer membrane lipoprotein carrier protein LolA [Deltaproteobacteria bacterium]|nr:outer membrane lipoprotein carrier protein LolA [Deltaproteobacteria bacterium]MBW2663057.1 outer membrane lipoprotein carrier protein LolA [Deltaproteobacteria bacterium]